MRLGAGEILQCCAVGTRRQQTNVDLETIRKIEADLVFAFGDDAVDAGIGCGVVDSGGRVSGLAGGTGYQQVKVTGGFTAATQRSGGCYPLDAGEVEKPGRDTFGGLFGLIDAETAG